MRLISRRSFLGGTAGLSAATLLPKRASFGEKAGPFALQRYMRALHRWYCGTFFDFDKHLAPIERRYVETSIDLMEAREHRIHRNFFYSTSAYSHRVRGAKVNSSRMAHGSLQYRDRLREPLSEILRHRGISAREIANLADAFGTGWDVESDHLKVYIHLRNLRDIEDREVARLLRKAGDEKVYDFGLVSYTFAGGKLSERKVYLAVRDRHPAPVRDLPFRELITHTNYMITDCRGIVPQVDVKAVEFDGRHLNPKGREICQTYRAALDRVLAPRDALADTIAFQSRDEFTLYF